MILNNKNILIDFNNKSNNNKINLKNFLNFYIMKK